MCSLECEQLINLEGLQGACNSRSESLQAAPIAFNWNIRLAYSRAQRELSDAVFLYC